MRRAGSRGAQASKNSRSSNRSRRSVLASSAAAGRCLSISSPASPTSRRYQSSRSAPRSAATIRRARSSLGSSWHEDPARWASSKQLDNRAYGKPRRTRRDSSRRCTAPRAEPLRHADSSATSALPIRTFRSSARSCQATSSDVQGMQLRESTPGAVKSRSTARRPAEGAAPRHCGTGRVSACCAPCARAASTVGGSASGVSASSRPEGARRPG